VISVAEDVEIEFPSGWRHRPTERCMLANVANQHGGRDRMEAQTNQRTNIMESSPILSFAKT
jgi:hypothetical protein